VALKLLLACGILSPLLFVAMNVFVPRLFDGYSLASQTISELSAIGAPTRSLWVWLGTVYGLLFAAFGWGVWKSAGPNRPLRVAGALIVADGVVSLFWPPMHLRGQELTLTDTMHIVWTIVTGLLMMLAVGFAAVAFGKWFRLYSSATLMIFFVFGALTGMEGPRVAANLPTPWIGVWERIIIAAQMLWIAVLAVTLLRNQAVWQRTTYGESH
jgi:uncharacterized protein DUF998